MSINNGLQDHRASASSSEEIRTRAEQLTTSQSAMASSIAKTACLLVLALFVISAVILPTSVCHGARGVGG